MSQINPNSSRFDKIKKLFHISSELISEYGLSYFLRIAFRELLLQKTALFSPDKTSIEIKNEFIVEYDDFLKTLQNNIERDSLKIQDFSIQPSFSLILFVDRNMPSIKKFLDEQIYKNFEFVLISSQENYIDSFISQNNLINFQKLVVDNPKINDITSISEYDFFVFLNDDSKLQSDFLFNIVHHINQNNPVTDVYYFDEDFLDKNKKRFNPFFKPDWNAYLLRSYNYIGNCFVINKELLVKLNDFSLSEKNFHYDLILHCAENTDKFTHISIPSFSTSKTQKMDQSKILENHITRQGLNAKIKYYDNSNSYRVNYLLEHEPKVSILIPTKNNKSILKRCIDSLKNNTNYENFEIIIIDNNSDDKETLEYYDSLDCKIISYAEPFNFSKMNNLGYTKSHGDYILCLNDDTKALDPDWLTEMVSICQQNDVGIVGAKLLHSNGTIQHAGAVFLKSGSGFHVFENILEKDTGFFNMHNMIRNFSAVTGACLLIKNTIFEKINGYDDDFDLFYGDADLCLKTLKAGFHVVYTPYARLLHEGSTTIKKNSESFFAIENHLHFIKKWSYLKHGDPFYNFNLGWNYTIEKLH